MKSSYAHDHNFQFLSFDWQKHQRLKMQFLIEYAIIEYQFYFHE